MFQKKRLRTKALRVIGEKKHSSKTEFLQVKVKLGHGILYFLRAAASVLLDLIIRDIYWCDCQHRTRDSRHPDTA